MDIDIIFVFSQKRSVPVILSDSKSTIDFSKMEFIPECSADFPTACYAYNLLSRTEPWHWHDQFEIAFLLSGQAKLLLEGREYLLSAGSGYMINSGALHALTNEPDISCQVCCIVFSKELPGGNHDSLFYRKYVLPLVQSSFTGTVLDPSCEWQNQLCSFARQAAALFEQEPQDYEIQVRTLLTQVLAILVRHLPQNTLSVPAASSHNPDIKKMLLFIWQHYQEPLTLAEIASSGATSKNECMLCFNRTVGLSPIQYVKSYRLVRAKELLSSGTLKIAQIAELCGFQDTSYFSKSFREKYLYLIHFSDK